MSLGRKIWRTGWRVVLCALLLAWICHAIFYNEGEALTKESRPGVWENLARTEKWRVAWTQGPPRLWRTLTLVPVGPLAASFGLMGLTVVLGVVRWRLALRVHGIELSFGRAMEISFVAHFFNSFLLGSTGGDLMKAYYAARETQHRKTEAVVTVFVDRLIGLWAMLLFAAVMMLPNLSLLFDHPKLRLMSLAILGMLLGGSVFMVLAFRGGVTRGWAGARHWLRRLPKGEWLERSLDSCREFGRSRLFVTRALLVSMLLNAVCVAQVLMLSRALGLEVPALALFVMVPSIICLSALPITPSGLGVRENLFVYMLTAPPILAHSTLALSLSLLAYAGSLFWSLVGGLVYVTLKEKHHLAEADL